MNVRTPLESVNLDLRNLTHDIYGVQQHKESHLYASDDQPFSLLIALCSYTNFEIGQSKRPF